jgi:acetyl-CoA carboxylase carboxyl transferase subunit alpha
MKGILDFEIPIIELKNKISDLKTVMNIENIDVTEEILKLEHKLQLFEQKIYEGVTPWDRVQISRHPERPSTLDYIEHVFTDFIELHGDRAYGDDLAMIGGIARFENQPVTVIGHQRGKSTKENIYRNFGMPHPEGYRKALRLMRQAEKFNRPIITFIDTKGAYPGKEAEERGQSQAIAHNIFEMAALTVPIISIVIGEGGSGGALGIGVSNHIYMLENSTYSVISPEGAAALLWKNSSKAKNAAETMKITAQDLKSLGIIEGIIPEVRGGAHNDLALQSLNIKNTISQALMELTQINKEELVKNRYKKYKDIGSFSIKGSARNKEKVLVVN